MIADPGRRSRLDALMEGPGMVRLDPPILLPADPYFNLAGEEFRRRLLITAGTDGGEYCLRPEFTLPLAQRFLAEGNPEAVYTYSGPVFRQRVAGPAQFEQAGIEVLGSPDGGAALDRVFDFALEGLALFGIEAPVVKLGSVALFEALLHSLDMPDVWRPRLRHRFGHPQMLAQLLARLPEPHDSNDQADDLVRKDLVERVAAQMHKDGLALHASRTPEEIADRYLEKQALAAAAVPEPTVAALEAFLAISGPLDTALEQVSALEGVDPVALQAPLAALKSHQAFLRARAPQAQLRFDAGFAPRLDYYTGLVFEILGQTGAILASGGQYDRLLQRLGADREIPAAGCSLWIERLEGEGRP